MDGVVHVFLHTPEVSVDFVAYGEVLALRVRAHLLYVYFKGLCGGFRAGKVKVVVEFLHIRLRLDAGGVGCVEIRSFIAS